MRRTAGLVLLCIGLAASGVASAKETKKDCSDPNVILSCVMVPWEPPIPATNEMGKEGDTWHAPFPLAVPDAHAAITIAHAEWQSMHPKSNVGSDEDWQSAFQATLVKGVWEIATKTWTDTHGAFVVYIKAQDGQLLNAQYVD